MSAAMIKSHGGSKDIVSTQRKGGLVLTGIVRDTMANSPKNVHMRSLENLVSQTTGVPRAESVMEGVISATVPADRRDVPELHPVHETDKTASKMSVGIPYAGRKSGYGQAQKGKSKKA
jgi:hypothetical protein